MTLDHSPLIVLYMYTYVCNKINKRERERELGGKIQFHQL